jgi:hypothetical protein
MSSEGFANYARRRAEINGWIAGRASFETAASRPPQDDGLS